jgi:hypothetical protein
VIVLGGSWLRTSKFLPFLPDSIDKSDELLEWYESDLHELLTMKYNVFWSHVLFDPSLMSFLDSFLRFFPRPITSALHIETRAPALPVGWDNVFHSVFRVFVRLSFYKESASNFMERKYYSNTIYNKVCG